MMEAVGLAKVKKVAPEPKLLAPNAMVDQTTLQSVIANRYEVMAKYTKSIKKMWRTELAHLRNKAKLEDEFLASSKKLLQCEPAKLKAVDMQQLKELFAHSKTLKTMHEMRVELSVIWERSSDTREQLVQKLQDWCKRAEESGIHALQEFAFRLRRYA
jgi:stearoyl-CoA desaturase (delta-9 desaturase)